MRNFALVGLVFALVFSLVTAGEVSKPPFVTQEALVAQDKLNRALEAAQKLYREAQAKAHETFVGELSRVLPLVKKDETELAKVTKALERSRIEVAELRYLMDVGGNAKKKYQCMLGRYSNDKGLLPAIFLEKPNGANVGSACVLQAFRSAGISLGSGLHFRAAGNFFLTSNMTVKIVAFEGLAVDGKKYAASEYVSGLELAAGVHQVEVSSWQAPSKVAITIMDVAKRQIPIWNFGDELEAFKSSPVEGEVPVEVSGWNQTKNRLE